MIELVPISEHEKWDKIVKSFVTPEVYYLSGYVKAFQKNGDGEPFLLYYNDESAKAICVMMKRDVADDKYFSEQKLPINTYFDAITPYGYGGFFFDQKEVSDLSITNLNIELKEILASNEIISAFFRFHPLFCNAIYHRHPVEVINLGKTIAMDLTSPDVIWENITSKNRNAIRKAQKNGVIIKHGKGIDLFNQFRKIYEETMDNDNADEYYYFSDDFYKSIVDDLSENYEIFYAEYDGQIISMAIIIFEGTFMHYHLSGSVYSMRHLAPSNLLLYQAALWGHEQGYTFFHMGGGLGSGEDSLFKFKAGFNRHSENQFSIGKLIIDEIKYNFLLNQRDFLPEQKEVIKFFPAYRAPIQ